MTFGEMLSRDGVESGLDSGSQALQSGMLFKILNKPCPPQKLSAAISAAIDERDGKNTEEEKAPDNIL